MAGLLDYASSVAGEAQKNVKGLLADPKQALMGILNTLAQKAADSQAKTNAAWATGNPGLMAQNALDSSQTALGFAPLGITAYHGSPHLFDKFKNEAIGTGEGAQAYGHGMYLAENSGVANEYADALGKEVLIKGKPAFRAKGGTMAGDLPVSSGAANHLRMNDWDLQKSIKDAENKFVDTGDQWFAKVHKELSTLNPEDVKINHGQMYKTDIPEEAVSRFLDWDKPLSQQAPEVRSALSDIGILGNPSDVIAKRNSIFSDFDSGKITRDQRNSLLETLGAKISDDALGQSVYMRLGNAEKAASLLNSKGIKGIQYLDGFSRGPQGGSGTKNFVAFDPEMIRILERNGQATGNLPWQPGEWQGLLK